jgi:hypothetical protein
LATGCTRTVGAMRCAGVTSAEHFHHTAKIQGKQYNLYTHLIMSAVWQWPLLFTVFFSFLQGTFSNVNLSLNSAVTNKSYIYALKTTVVSAVVYCRTPRPQVPQTSLLN